MPSIKQLAGQTALYGVSSILGRLLNYLLIILYTEVFAMGEYGIVTKLYAYVGFFLVICTFGMETGFFRFASKDKQNADKIYTQAHSFVFLLGLLICGAIYLNSELIAQALDYSDDAQMIRWIAIIIFIDVIVAVPFARLRYENRPLYFAIIRFSSIILTILLNILFLLVFPSIHHEEYLAVFKPLVNMVYDPDLGVGYVFLANLLGNALMLVFLGKYILMIRLKFDRKLIIPMVVYSFPILITGLSGMANENLDKILLVELLPDYFYAGQTSIDSLGVYGAVYKLSVFMILAIQAFRYAAEPFFFSNAEDKQAPQLFARIMYYFVLATLVIYVGVVLNMDLIGRIFLRDPDFRQGLFVVPFLLTGKLFFGIYINLSIWFKLTGKTVYGTWFSILGAVVTIIGNILLVPILGYLGSAITLILCYFTMSAACYYYGQKNYFIPYNVKKIFIQIGIAVGFSLLIYNIEFNNKWVQDGLGIFFTMAYAGILFFYEKKKLFRKT